MCPLLVDFDIPLFWKVHASFILGSFGKRTLHYGISLFFIESEIEVH